VVERLPRKPKALGSVPSSEKKNQKKKKKKESLGKDWEGPVEGSMSLEPLSGLGSLCLWILM